MSADQQSQRAGLDGQRPEMLRRITAFPARGGRVVAHRARRAGRAVQTAASSATIRVHHSLWSAASRPGVPEDAWPTATVLHGPEEPLARRIVPLPPALGLARWLWGARAVGNDGGDRSADRLGLRVVAGSTEAFSHGAFAAADLPRLLTERVAGSPRSSLHTLVVSDQGAGSELLRQLRRRGLHRGILVIDDPGPDRRAALLSLVSAVAVPARNDALGAVSDWELEAQAAGIMAISHDPGRPLPAALGTPQQRRIAGRAARQALALGTDGLWSSDRATPDPHTTTAGVEVGREPRRVVVAGHDLKFAGSLIDHLRNGGHDVRLDAWAGHARHDPRGSRQLAAWADVVLCEWTLGNAVWYSRHVPDGVRLVTRLHLQEVATAFPERVRAERLDAAVFVAEHVRRQVVRDQEWPEARTTVVPNDVRIPPSTPRDADNRFRLGLVGMVPSRKGLRTALDVLTALRTVDPRYTLSLRGRTPDEYPWLSDRPEEQAYFQEQMRRIRTEPLLASGVEFSPFGPDMDRWFARIGVALSTSDFESFHFTLPDGAVHGAVPRSIAWPGADLLYPSSWLATDAESLAQSILATTRDPGTWLREAEQARGVVVDRFDEERILPRLAAVVLGQRHGLQ